MGNRAEAQSAALEPERVPEGTLAQVWPLSTPWPPPLPLLPQPSPGDSPGGVHGNVRLSWLLFASANLKNALVFPFRLGSPQQLPFMPIELGMQAVGARGC